MKSIVNQPVPQITVVLITEKHDSGVWDDSHEPMTERWIQTSHAIDIKIYF